MLASEGFTSLEYSCEVFQREPKDNMAPKQICMWLLHLLTHETFSMEKRIPVEETAFWGSCPISSSLYTTGFKGFFSFFFFSPLWFSPHLFNRREKIICSWMKRWDMYNLKTFLKIPSDALFPHNYKSMLVTLLSKLLECSWVLTVATDNTTQNEVAVACK